MHSTSHIKIYKPPVHERRVPQIAPPKKRRTRLFFRPADERVWRKCFDACPSRSPNERYRHHKKKRRVESPNMQRRKRRKKKDQAAVRFWGD